MDVTTKNSSGAAVAKREGGAGARHGSAGALAMRRQPTQERGRQTMDAVLNAAGAEIAQGGLDRLTTKRIAAAAGLSVGAVYEYFPNKESIVSELLARWLARLMVVLDEVHPRHGGSADLVGYLNAQVDRAIVVYEEQPGLGALFDMIGAMPALREVTSRHDELVTSSVSSALTHFVPRAEPAEIQTAARAIPIVCHEMLSAALVYRLGERERLIKYLRVCLMAMASRLLTA